MRGGVKLNLEPEVLFASRKDVVSRFVKLAIQEETHLIYPARPGLNPEGWIRNRNILGGYLLSSVTQEGIGQLYGLSTQSVQIAIRNSIKYLWLSSSPELKEQFMLPNKPSEQTPRPKKTVATRTPETKYLSKTAVKLVEMIQSEVNIEQIMKDLNIPHQKLAYFRQTLKKRGIEVPYLRKGRIKETQGISQKTRAYSPRHLRPKELLPEGKPIHPKLREVLSDTKFTFIDPKSREFLKQAFTEGAHLNTPPRMNSEMWLKDRNIFGTYILSHAPLGQVGKIYGISRERVRQINSEVLRKIYMNSSDEIKQQFPWSSISMAKSSRFLPKEWLLVKDNLGSDIVALLEQGVTPTQIKSRYAKRIERSQAIKVLKMLRELGVDIKRIKSAGGEYLMIEQELLKEDLSDEETQVLLDQVSDMRGIAVLRASGTIISIRNLLLSAGYHIKLLSQQRLFYDALIDEEIPLGMMENIIQNGTQKGIRYYYFIAVRHKQRAEEALKADPNLTKFLENPVKQISGPKSKIPTTTKIMNKGRGVVNLAFVLRELGIYAQGKKSNEMRTAIFQNNSLAVFSYAKGYHIFEDDLEKAKSIIRSKLESGNP